MTSPPQTPTQPAPSRSKSPDANRPEHRRAAYRRRRGSEGAEELRPFSPPEAASAQNDRRNCRSRQFRCVPGPREPASPLPSPPLTRPREAAHVSAASQTNWKDQPVSHTSLTDTTPRSHRPGETAENYARRLTRARLKKSDGPRSPASTNGWTPSAPPAACRQPTAFPGPPRTSSNGPDLTSRERYLDLKTYALASDRIARAEQRGIAADTLRVTA